jgi:hypothetical protein
MATVGQIGEGAGITGNIAGGDQVNFCWRRAFDHLVAQGLQMLAEIGVIKQKAGYFLEYPQPFPDTVDVGIDQTQH